jgi:putative transposase
MVLHHAGLRFRFHPNAEQENLLRRTFGCGRVARNTILAERQQRWRETGKGMSYAEMDKRLTAMKRDTRFAWMNEVSAVALQQAIRHLHDAYQRFFKREGGFPNFAKRDGRQSATFVGTAFQYLGRGVVMMPKSDVPLDIVWSSPLWGEPSKMTISLESDGTWWASFGVEVETIFFEGGNEAAGIDVGRTVYATVFDGDHVEEVGNVRPMEVALKRLRKKARRLSKAKKGGQNCKKRKMEMAREHARIRRLRKDYLDKLSTRLVRENQAIVVETLNIKGMLKNRRDAFGTADCAWHLFTSMLEYKCVWYGRDFVALSQWFPSSKTCFDCKYVNRELGREKVWTCPNCSAVHDRDHNAARNIRAEGLSVLAHVREACGGDVRHRVRLNVARLLAKQEFLKGKTEVAVAA